MGALSEVSTAVHPVLLDHTGVEGGIHRFRVETEVMAEVRGFTVILDRDCISTINTMIRISSAGLESSHRSDLPHGWTNLLQSCSFYCLTLVKSQDPFLSLKPNDSNSFDPVDNIYLNIVKAAKIHIMKTNRVIELKDNLYDLVESLSNTKEVEAPDHRADKILRRVR